MPKYSCDYCEIYLTHDSPSVRKTHRKGRRHKENVKLYYQDWMEEEVKRLIDATEAALKAEKIAYNPFAQPGTDIAMPSPTQLSMGQIPGGPGGPQMMPPKPMGPGGLVPFITMDPSIPMPAMMGISLLMMKMGPTGLTEAVEPPVKHA